MGWESVFVGGLGWHMVGLHVGHDPVNEVGSLCVYSWVASLSAPDHDLYHTVFLLYFSHICIIFCVFCLIVFTIYLVYFYPICFEFSKYPSHCNCQQFDRLQTLKQEFPQEKDIWRIFFWNDRRKDVILMGGKSSCSPVSPRDNSGELVAAHEWTWKMVFDKDTHNLILFKLKKNLKNSFLTQFVLHFSLLFSHIISYFNVLPEIRMIDAIETKNVD